MNKVIEIKNKKIQYKLRNNTRGRNLRLSIGLNGKLSVSKPRFLSQLAVENFLIDKFDWIMDKMENFVKTNFFASAEEERLKYLKHRREALNFIQSRIEELNRIYNFKYSRVSIRNQKTRWGSCSRRGSLNFNYRVLFLERELADYIVVHELCHLKEFNHSKNFWNLVALSFPNYLNLRKILRKTSFN